MAQRVHGPPARAPGRQALSPSAARASPAVASVLKLQRTAGNVATRRVLARDTKTAPSFRLLLADHGKHGLSESVVNEAVKAVRAEMDRITKDSKDPSVAAGVDIQYVKTPPTSNDEFTHDLGRHTFLIFLTRGKDAKGAVELLWDYIPEDKKMRETREARFKKSMAGEGGVDIQTIDKRRGAQSVGFVGTDMPLAELTKKGAGAASAAAVLSDVILHELGHALGHNDVLSSMDHDEAGIMTKSIVLGSEGAHQPRQFSAKSAKIVVDRLEELSGKYNKKKP